MDRYEELARQATWVASKVSSDVHGVDTMVEDGQQHGLGKTTLADGEVGHDGEWENGEAKE